MLEQPEYLDLSEGPLHKDLMLKSPLYLFYRNQIVLFILGLQVLGCDHYAVGSLSHGVEYLVPAV